MKAVDARRLMPLGIDDGLELAYTAIKMAAKAGQDRVTLDGPFWGKPADEYQGKGWTQAVSILTLDGFKVDYDAKIFVTRISW
jgi:hypothetical protein